VLPGWLRGLAGLSAAALLVSAVLWLSTIVLLRVALVTYSLAVAVLLIALLAPLAGRLRRLHLPGSLAALTAIVLLLAAPIATGVLIYSRVSSSFDELGTAVTAGIDELRNLLVDGPLHLDQTQIGGLRDSAVKYLQHAAPTPVAGATSVLQALSAAVLSCSPCSSCSRTARRCGGGR